MKPIRTIAAEALKWAIECTSSCQDLSFLSWTPHLEHSTIFIPNSSLPLQLTNSQKPKSNSLLVRIHLKPQALSSSSIPQSFKFSPCDPSSIYLSFYLTPASPPSPYQREGWMTRSKWA
ncbi:hypothetical protein ACFX13_012390 [Malus domestica]